MSRRWVCPHCGTGVLGPERPRRDDVRRYCLTCSEETGRLVERTCPAQEKERAARAVTNKDRAAVAADRARTKEAERRTVDGIDMLAEARRYWRLPAVRELRGWRDMPPIEIRRSKRGQRRSSGTCYYHRIVVTFRDCSASARATMLHEIVHAAFGPDEGHSQRFWTVLRRAAREAWPDATFNFKDARNGWQTQRAIADGLEL